MCAYKFETLQLHVGQETADPVTDSRAVPIYQTTSYVFHNSEHAAARFGLADAGNIYGRLTNSTQDVLEKRVAALEGGVAALAVAAGAAAITYTIEALAQAGDHIVAQKTIYGGSFNLLSHTLPLYGIDTTFVDAHDLAQVEAAIRPNTKAIYAETLGNPTSDIPDIDALAAIAHAHGIPLVVDNTFGAAYWVRPIDHGADIVVHSATKFFGGHGTTLGGIIVDSGKFDWKASGKYAPIAEANPSYHGVSFVDAAGPAAFVTYIRAILLRDTGACISPFNAFLLLQGIETLSLRLDRHAENTAKVVEFLARPWPSYLSDSVQPVTVGEPTPEQAVGILRGLRDKYEAHHIRPEHVTQLILYQPHLTSFSPWCDMLFLHRLLMRIEAHLFHIFSCAFRISTMRADIKIIIADNHQRIINGGFHLEFISILHYEGVLLHNLPLRIANVKVIAPVYLVRLSHRNFLGFSICYETAPWLNGLPPSVSFNDLMARYALLTG